MRAASRRVASLQKQQNKIESELAEAAQDPSAHERLSELGRELAGVAKQMAEAEETWLVAATEAEERGLEVAE